MSMDLPYLICKRCEHKWHPRNAKLPDVCPKCKSRYWNKERRITRVAKVAAKVTETPLEETIDPIMLRSIITKAIMTVREGKVITIQELTKSQITYEPIVKDLPALIGITPTDMFFTVTVKETKQRLKITEPCYTKEHEAALNAKYDEIMRGLCDGSLHSDCWCSDCESYYRIPELGNKYFAYDEIEKMNKNREIPYRFINSKNHYVGKNEDGAQSCDINYGKMAGLTNP